ncbi:MAG TPA: TonB family protein [Gammaproteobacteria bacterium]|nr:TonB family protein [Gammaproteobacteria bacterium]
MIGRIATAIALGAGVTFGLLFLMQMLIASGRGLNADARRFEISDFVRVEREQRVEREENKPEKPPEPEQQPDMPNPDQNTNYDNSLAVSMAAPSVTTSVNVGGLGFGVSDGEYLPIVKVAPVYPTRAASRGLEGYVIVEFTVTQTGATKDIFVVESTSSLFERAAVDAAAKFKYKPRVIDGNPVEVAGVRNKITFVLEN